MRAILSIGLVGTFVACFATDAPFPDTAKNHWVYASMASMKKEHLWYRMNDDVPIRKVATRNDLATKTVYLAIDSMDLVRSFENDAKIVTMKASDNASKKWAEKYSASFPAKKAMYQAHLRRVTKLWGYFQPEIKKLAKKMKVDPQLISHNLVAEKAIVDHLHIKGKVALFEGFPDVPANHWAATSVNDLKNAGILVGYPPDGSARG